MRVYAFFNALKQAIVGRLGKAVLDEIEHGERLEAARRQAELASPPSDSTDNLARESLLYFEEVIEVAESRDFCVRRRLLNHPDEQSDSSPPSTKRRRRTE